MKSIKHSIFTNWRTSLMGFGTALILKVWPMIEAGQVDPKGLAIAAFITLWGFVSKDAMVSGLPSADKVLSIGKRLVNAWKALSGKNLTEIVPTAEAILTAIETQNAEDKKS
jgi:hypothetical protein